MTSKRDLHILDPPQAGVTCLGLQERTRLRCDLVPLAPAQLQRRGQRGRLLRGRQRRRQRRGRRRALTGEQRPAKQHAASREPAACAKGPGEEQGYSPLPVASPSAPASTLTVLVTVPVTVAVQVLPEQLSVPTLMLSTRV